MYESAEVQLVMFTDCVQNMQRRALLFIDNRQFIGFLRKHNWVVTIDINF